MWDNDRRYQSYLKFATTTFDSQNFVLVIDNVLYSLKRQKNSAYQTIYDFNQWFSITLWVYAMSMRWLSQKLSVDEKWYTLDAIERYPSMHDFQVLMTQLWWWIDRLTVLDIPEIKSLLTWMYRFTHILSQQHLFVRKYDNQWFEVSFKPVYIDYSEYRAFFSAYQTYFISNKSWTPVLGGTYPWSQVTTTSWAWLEWLRDIQMLFIYQSNKNGAKKVFDYLIKNKRDEQKTILVENITWWKGKQLARLATSKNSVIVWSGDLLYLLRSAWHNPRIVVIWNLGTFHDLITKDLALYTHDPL